MSDNLFEKLSEKIAVVIIFSNGNTLETSNGIGNLGGFNPLRIKCQALPLFDPEIAFCRDYIEFIHVLNEELGWHLAVVNISNLESIILAGVRFLLVICLAQHQFR